MGLPAFRAASEALLAHRRDQRGFRTLGDAHDRALAEALAQETRADAAVLAEVESIGERLGRDVYARRFFEDSLARATEVLSTCLTESGLGSLHLEGHFHRTALLRCSPAPGLAPTLVLALTTGVARGFYGSAFNCRAHVEPRGDALHLKLLEGRDVNHHRGSSA